MNRSTRMQPIVKLASHDEREASIKLSATDAQLVKHRQMLAELESYHADYTRQNVVNDASSVRLQDFRLFMDRLETAITRQREVVAKAVLEVQTHRDEWSNQRSHRRALDNVTARYARHEALAADQAEQRDVDEIAALLRCRPNM